MKKLPKSRIRPLFHPLCSCEASFGQLLVRIQCTTARAAVHLLTSHGELHGHPDLLHRNTFKMFLSTSHKFLIQVLSLVRTCSLSHPCIKRQNVSFKYYGNITSDKDAQNATECRVHLHLCYLCWDILIVLLLPFIWLGKFLHIHANSQASASVRFMM